MGAAAEIIRWSARRPRWQRDALRRLATKDELTQSDLDELVLIAKEQHGLVAPSSPAPTAVPLSSEHLPDRPTGEAISLLALSDVKSVNALAPNQRLDFEPQGLTVIYGDNATGKSGYIRILKRLCRARAAETQILGNVFEAEIDDTPCASIEYAVGGVSSRVDWSDAAACSSELSAVSIFDSPSAAVYLNREHDVAYLPFGLDLLHKLADACGEIASRLEQQRSLDTSNLDVMPPHLATTASAGWLATTTARTTVKDIDDHARYSMDDAREKARLGEALAEQQPEKRAAELEVRRSHYENLLSRLLTLADTVTDEKVQALKEAHRQLREAENATVLANAQRFGNLPIPIGSSAWQQLWEAAEEFKRELHTEHAALIAEGPERCPLCQQVLDRDAERRFEAFAEYFLGKSQSDETNKRKAFEKISDEFAKLPLAIESYTEVLDDLRIDDHAIESSISAHLDRCRAIKAFVESAKSSTVLQEAPAVESLDVAPLRATIERLNSQADALRAMANPELSKKLRERAAELEAKAWLAGRRDELIKEVERLKRQARLQSAIDDTATTGITRKATELTQAYVTEELRRSFEAELLNSTSLVPPVKLFSRVGKKGVSHYRLEIDGAVRPGTKTKDVLSEGEMRAVSLAAFLSELSTEDTKSAVILDDPISSLDIRNRELVAKRLVGLASERQVIVFTHDVFFLATLLEEAREAGVKRSTCMVERMLNAAGVVVADTPWEAKNLKNQLGSLREQCQEATREAKCGNVKSVYAHRDAICKGMRKAIEKAVEEELLCGIVVRYERPVRVGNVKRLSVISNDDLAFIDRLMTTYSKYEHSQTPESRVPPPDIDELQRDIEALEAWRIAFEKKKRDL